MQRKVTCPGCGQVQAGLVMVEGRLYVFRDEQMGTRILAYVCSACGRRVHHGEREDKLKPRKLKMPAR